jgi:hypothetical protein
VTATQVNESGWTAILLGAIALWAGVRMSARPKETNDALVEFVRRGHGIPDWARPADGGNARGLGLLLAAVGAGLLVLGVALLLASRG